MEDLVKYFCHQADYYYAACAGFGTDPVCTVKAGATCIGISGHVLNSKVSAFLSYYRPRVSKPYYEIWWGCEEGLLFPRVIIQGQGQYISTKVSGPGILMPQLIGREYCADREETRLKLQRCEESDSEKIENMAALQHDQFCLLAEGRNPMRSLILMSIVEEIQSQSELEPLSSAENCLLLFFAPNTVLSLKEYACGEEDTGKCRIILSFLSQYCAFMLRLLALRNGGKLTTLSFSRCFEEYWQISLEDILSSLLDHPDGPQRRFAAIPSTGIRFGEMVRETICECVDAAAYDNRVRAVKQIYLYLKDTLHGNDSVTLSQLDRIESYINDMRQYHRPPRAG